MSQNQKFSDIGDKLVSECLVVLKLVFQNDLCDVFIMVKVVLENLFNCDDFDFGFVVKLVGCVGCQQGKVFELIVMVDLKFGGVDYLWCILELIGGNMLGVCKVGIVYDMCFVIFDDDKKILFCIVYDGDWDIYIEDFVIKIFDLMDLLFVNVEGWFGIYLFEVKDFIVSYQFIVDGWYVDVFYLMVVEICCVQENQQVFEIFMDEYSKMVKLVDDMSEVELCVSQKKFQEFLQKVGIVSSGVV